MVWITKIQLQRKRELITAKEDEFLQVNSSKVVRISEPNHGYTGSRLGEYHCLQCDEVFSTTVDAMDRHLQAHEEFEVTRIYKYVSSRVAAGVRHHFVKLRPAEHTYWSKGKYRAGNFTQLCRVKVGAESYAGGSSWKCEDCGEETLLKKEMLIQVWV